jgi:hypothetical protein
VDEAGTKEGKLRSLRETAYFFMYKKIKGQGQGQGQGPANFVFFFGGGGYRPEVKQKIMNCKKELLVYTNLIGIRTS